MTFCEIIESYNEFTNKDLWNTGYRYRVSLFFDDKSLLCKRIRDKDGKSISECKFIPSYRNILDFYEKEWFRIPNLTENL